MSVQGGIAYFGRHYRVRPGADLPARLVMRIVVALEAPGRVTYSQPRVAASYDPAAFRASWKINGMVCPPGEVYTDPDVVACTRETFRRHATAPPVAQPTREQLLTALAR